VLEKIVKTDRFRVSW